LATDLKRYTITITEEIEKDLQQEKKETYYAKTQSDMIRDLIIRGLDALRAEKADKAKDHENKR